MQVQIVPLLLLSILTGFYSYAQTKSEVNRHTEVLEIASHQFQPQLFEKADRNFFEASIAVPDFRDCPFVAMSVSWEQLNEDGDIKHLLYKYDGEPALLPRNHHIEQASDARSSELVYLPFDDHILQLKIITTGKPILKLKVHFFNPGLTKKSIENQSGFATQRTSICPCPQPEYLTRSQWCPNGQCPPNPAPVTTLARHLIIHHSAGTNVSSDWPAIVRSIWDYHVNTNGWPDIGYNWLVDPEGNLYEGQGKDVRGAHFCGMNSKTMGICVLGNFTDVEPQEAATTSLTEMLAWYCCEDNIDPLGIGPISGSSLDLYRISGHQDGCATLCPGDTFYPLLPDVRVDVADYIDQNCTVGQTDLLVESLYTDPVDVYVDETIVLFAKIKNGGNTSADSFMVTRTLNGDVLATNLIVSLAAEDSETLAFTYSFDEGGTATFCMEIEPLSGEINIDNNNSCFDINVESLTTANEIAATKIAIVPNPNNGVFFIEKETNQAAVISVYNANGQVILSPQNVDTNKATFDLSAFSKGVYIVKVELAEHVFFKKLMLQ